MAKKSTKLQAVSGLLSENNITSDSINLSDKLIYEIKGYAENIQDYRNPAYTRHLLSDIIMIAFFAVLGNANEWGEIETFGKSKERWLRKYLELPNGIPTDDTFRIVISNINTDVFFKMTVQLLISTIDEMMNLTNEEINEKDIIAIDGKESCGTGRKDTKDGNIKAMQMLNVYSNDYAMCIAEKMISEKSNEIPAARELLEMMDLKNSIITADALNCQKTTVDAITKGKGEYVLAVKANQKNLYNELSEYMNDPIIQEELRNTEGTYYKTVEKEHKGIAIREYYITENISWFKDKKEWKKLKSFGMVRKTLEKENGEIAIETRYYICSIQADAKEFSRAVRMHWGVENNLHWQLDFTFKDDKNTTMDKTGAKNLQQLKKISMAILKLVKESYKLSMKRIRYVLSLNYEEEIEKLFSMLDINMIKEALEQ